MPTWFFALTGVCAGFAIWRAIKKRGFYVGEARIATPIGIASIAIIAIAFGIMVAIQLGFITDHAP